MNKSRKTGLRQTTAVALTSTLLLGVATTGWANEAAAETTSTPAIQPFHIGIFNPPAPENVNEDTYAEIAEMNVNFIVGGNSHYTYDVNKRALDLAEQNGMKILVADTRFGWDEPMIEQLASTGTGGVSQTQSLGQTFAAPDRGTDWGLNYVSLQLDKQQWPTGAELTLTLYDSPAKSTTVAQATVQQPAVQDDQPTLFWLLTRVQHNTTYYMELTSTSADPVAVALSDQNPYTDGVAYSNGAAQSGSDLTFTVLFSESVFKNSGQPSLDTLEEVVADYDGHPALMGYNLYDEPSSTLFPALGHMVRTLRELDTDAMSLVNLWPSDADVSLTGMNENRDGSVLNTGQSVGQTFTTKSYEDEIRTVQWMIPADQWQSGEGITLRLWDSTAKATLIAEDFQGAPTPGHGLTFALNADVQPETTYYMELTHNGGGDNFFGVWRSASGTEWYNGGEGYANGQPIQADFWHTINQTIEPFSYEDHVYRWVRHDPDVMLYDYYPYYHDGSFSEEYYNNLEIVRRQSLAGGIDFWTFVQSVGLGTWLRSPSQDDMRHNIYTNLAYGSKGLIYFTYWHPVYEGFVGSIINPDGSRNPSYEWAKALNAEVLNLGNTLNRLSSKAVYHTGAVPALTAALPPSFFWQPEDLQDPWIISAFEDESGREYVMVVNRDMDNTQSSTFTLTTKPGLVTEISKTTGLEVATDYNYATGVLQAEFLPGEGRLYALDAEPDNYPPVAHSATYNVLANHAWEGNLQATDEGQQALQFELVQNAEQGTVVLGQTGAFSYTPDADAVGSDTFRFRVSDGQRQSNIATATLRITPELILTLAPGATAGSTRISANLGTGHTLAIALEDQPVPIPTAGVGVPGEQGMITPRTAQLDLASVRVGQHIGAYELDGKGNVVRFGAATIESGHIQAATSAGGLSYIPISASPVAPSSTDEAKPKDKDVAQGEASSTQGSGSSSAPSERSGQPIPPSFTDISGHWAYASIVSASARGLIQGYADGTFKPAAQTTRAELTVMLMRALNTEAKEQATDFADRERIGWWARSAIDEAHRLGYVQGYADGTFRPDAPVTRQELATILSRILKNGQHPVSVSDNAGSSNITDRLSIAGWASEAVREVLASGLMSLSADGSFYPLQSVTRAELATILIRWVEGQ